MIWVGGGVLICLFLFFFPTKAPDSLAWASGVPPMARPPLPNPVSCLLHHVGLVPLPGDISSSSLFPPAGAPSLLPQHLARPGFASMSPPAASILPGASGAKGCHGQRGQWGQQGGLGRDVGREQWVAAGAGASGLPLASSPSSEVAPGGWLGAELGVTHPSGRATSTCLPQDSAPPSHLVALATVE